MVQLEDIIKLVMLEVVVEEVTDLVVLLEEQVLLTKGLQEAQELMLLEAAAAEQLQLEQMVMEAPTHLEMEAVELLYKSLVHL